MNRELVCRLFCILTLTAALAALSDKAFAQSLVFGNPSDAASDVNAPDNYLLAHRNYILSYNRSRGAANWVAWHLSKSDIGNTERSESFFPDTLLPAAWRIKPGDYTGSGFDRGHLCPSKDRSDSIENNTETFLMSNMAPQTANLNRRTWRLLEEYTRTEVARNREAYVYAGCYGDNGKIKDKVTIPTNCFKIIVLLAEGGNDLGRVRANTRVIAVDMPNAANVSRRWRTYRTTVDTIEEATGFDFLATLPDEIEAVLESRTDDK